MSSLASSSVLTANEFDFDKSSIDALLLVLTLNEDQATSNPGPGVLSYNLDSGSTTLRTDTFPHTSQSRPATFQHDPTLLDQNPNSALSELTEAPPPSQLQETSQSHRISELAELAARSLGDVSRPLKIWLELAENVLQDAKRFHEQDNLESAFVEYTKATIIAIGKIPSHPDYWVFLSATQRHNISLVSYILPMAP